MRFIPKKKLLIEADANPLEVNSVDLSYDEQYTQAIMKAVASESGAIVEYEQILAIEPHVSKKSLVDLFHDTLIDIKDEEVKHLAQLNEKLSQTPSLKDSYEDGTEEAESGKDKNDETKDDTGNEEEVNESKELQTESTKLDENVPEDRTYDAENIAQLIASKYTLTDEQYEDIIDLLDPLSLNELSAEDVDRGLAKLVDKYKFTQEEKEEIEQFIVDNANDPKGDRIKEFKNDIGYDINTLENLLDEFNTYAAQQRVKQLIAELKELEYDGSDDIGWNPKYHNFNNKKRGLIS